MEDRYLFKARSVYEINEWVVGYYIVFNGKDSIFEKKPEKYYSIEAAETSCGNRITEVIPETICQCTGLKDKNGKLIWENDIVRVIYDGIEHAYVVKWDADEIDFKATNGKENYEGNFQYLGCCDEVEIIGNELDNPELLEV